MGPGARRGFGIVVVGLLAQPAAADVALQTFIETYRCDVLTAVAVSALPTARLPSNAFVVLARQDRPQAYVQCLMAAGVPSAVCEISSGRLGPSAASPGALKLTAAKEHIVVRLGFELSESGNHRRIFADLPGGGVGEIADLMLTVQALVFDSTLDSPLALTAPRASWKSRRLAACPLLSNLAAPGAQPA